MRDALALRQIDHADRALQHRIFELNRGVISAERQIEILFAEIVEQQLVASFHRRPHFLSLGWRVPFRCGSDRAGVGGESDEARVVAEALAYELPDVQLAALSHLGRASVAEMGVVLPDDDLCVAASAAAEMIGQREQRLGHVLIAQVPR